MYRRINATIPDPVHFQRSNKTKKNEHFALHRSRTMKFPIENPPHPRKTLEKISKPRCAGRADPDNSPAQLQSDPAQNGQIVQLSPENAARFCANPLN